MVSILSIHINMIKIAVILFILFCSSAATADKLALIQSLTLCNPNFFKEVYVNKSELQKYTTIRTFDKNKAYISVENRTDTYKNYTYFKIPMTYKNLTIKGYYDSDMDLGKLGKYYFWGFIIDNDINQIKETLNFIDWKNTGDNLMYFANPMIHYINEEIHVWNKNTGTVVGVKTVPAPGTTEKLLLLEKYANMNLLLCSIQGTVTVELLKQERPDIK